MWKKVILSTHYHQNNSRGVKTEKGSKEGGGIQRAMEKSRRRQLNSILGTPLDCKGNSQIKISHIILHFKPEKKLHSGYVVLEWAELVLDIKLEDRILAVGS